MLQGFVSCRQGTLCPARGSGCALSPAVFIVFILQEPLGGPLPQDALPECPTSGGLLQILLQRPIQQLETQTPHSDPTQTLVASRFLCHRSELPHHPPTPMVAWDGCQLDNGKPLSLSVFIYFVIHFFSTPAQCWFSLPSPTCQAARPGGCSTVANNSRTWAGSVGPGMPRGLGVPS